MSEIGEQYDDIKPLTAEKVKTGSIPTFTDVISYVSKDDDMKEVSFVLVTCDTFQVSSADCDRGLSLMNTLRTKSRSMLELKHLDNVTSIKFLP